MNEAACLALIFSAPLAIPAMVWLCWCIELADIINHPERHPYLMLVYVSMQDDMVAYSASPRRSTSK